MPDAIERPPAPERRRVLAPAARLGLLDCVLARFALVIWEADEDVRAEYRTLQRWTDYYIAKELRAININRWGTRR